MLSGGSEQAHQVRNLQQTRAMNIRILDHQLSGQARLPAADSDEDASVRRRLLEKYQPSYSDDLSGWERTSLAVTIDLELER